MAGQLTESIYGPFLRFESYKPPAVFGDEAVWKGSALSVCHKNATAEQSPSCLVVDGQESEVLEGYRVDVYKEWEFWRFDMTFTLKEDEREICYQLQLASGPQELWTFYVPGETQVWRWSAYSCSGFSHDVKEEEWMINGDHPLVGHLLRKHEEKPLHLNFGGGDQLYNDGVFQEAGFRDWLAIQDRHTRHSCPFSSELRDEAEDYYFKHYCLHFSVRSLKEMCARIPNVMLWDDHDIFDGWGSYPHDMLAAPIFFGIFSVARKFYLLFQHHTTLEQVKDGNTDLFGNSPMSSPSFSFLKLIGPTVAILGVDIRSERTKDQIMSPESWAMAFSKAKELPDSVRHLIVNFTVPIVYPKVPVSEGLLEMVSQMTHISALNALLVKTNILSSLMKFEFEEPELLDDLVDHWTGPHHSEERKKVVEQFQQLAVQKQLRITFLSGDVHCAAVGRFYTYPKMHDLSLDPFFMPQIITSAIINPPPPQVAIKLMHGVDHAGNRINSTTREKMVRFFRSRYPREEKVLPRRNFLIVEGHSDGALKATFYVERSRQTMGQNPEEFPLLVPQLKTDVGTRSDPTATPSKKSPPLITGSAKRMLRAFESFKEAVSKKSSVFSLKHWKRSLLKQKTTRSRSFNL